ncbi:MAG: N-acetylmuramoyl-L-alanine amidase [Clostridium sp.]|nr:N-acetylmuramoyl-L-alanine amidase [Clostridium sp.]
MIDKEGVVDNSPVKEQVEEVVIIKTFCVLKDTNLYSKPDLNDENKLELKKDSQVDLISEQDQWSKVVYNQETYYILNEFLGEEKAMEIKLIVIDAGHQAQGSSTKEENGPGSSILKARVSSGTRGVSTGLCEYELNLMVTLKLKVELENRGYEVLLVRDRHEVDISNIERAQVANEVNADAFIRIHANGANDSSVHGALTICQTSNNPYNSAPYPQSYDLSQKVLSEMVDATGAKNRGIWQTDTMTGINWSNVPSTIVEMGFMSNSKEDQLLSTESYQDQIVQGISNGIDEYFKVE